MTLIADIILVGLAALSAATMLYSVFLALRVRSSLARIPTARAGVGLPEPDGGWPSVCIVVPAHDEERVIGPMARSLLAQRYPRLRVVFSLDRCGDNTEREIRAAVGDDERFEIVHIEHCPDDWAGKTHAVWRGVTESGHAADADLLLFADADTTFDPDCIRATVALLLDRRLDMLSLLSTLSSRRWWELVAQPATAFELLRHSPIHRVNIESKSRPAFANGQFMLFRADSYRGIGGHESVRSELLEDIAFARALRNAGMRNGLMLADRMLHCRMYDSWDAYKRGWKRIYIEAARRRPARLRTWARRLVFTDVVMPTAAACCLILGLAAVQRDAGALGWTGAALGAGALIAWFLAMMFVHHVQRSPLWTALAHPAGAWITASVLRSAASDLEAGRGVTWAGRTYLRESRS